MKKQLLFYFIFFTSLNVYSTILDKVDKLNHEGEYKQAFQLLEKSLDLNNPDPRILWRMSRELFEIAETIPMSKKSEKIEAYTKAMEVVEPYLNVKKGERGDISRIIFFYAANFGSRGRTIGVIESLNNLPKLKELTDKSLKIDPSLSLAYLLKAKIEEEVPTIFGGDKFKMGLLYSDALKYDPNNLTFIYDAANALYKRNWKSSKKESLANNKGITGYSSINVDDRVLVKFILENGIKIFNKLEEPSVRDIEQFNKIKKLLEKYN